MTLVEKVTRDMQPKDWFPVAVTVIGFVFTIGSAHARFNSLERDFDELEERVWQMRGNTTLTSQTAQSCPADATRVAFYTRLP